MRKHLSGFVLLVLLTVAGVADESAQWKMAGKLKLPSAPTAALISDDHSFVLVQTTRKVKRVSGGTGPGLIDITTLRCLEVASGKEQFARDLGAISDLMSVRGQHFACIPNLADKVVVYDVRGFRECVCSTPDSLPTARRADARKDGRLWRRTHRRHRVHPDGKTRRS